MGSEMCIRDSGYSVEKSETDEWTRILNRKGWAAPHWPVEVGGAQWSAVRRHLFDIELRSAHAPELQGFGFSMVGPAIIKYGSEDQKNKYLPRILNAEMSWCQGYSEPQAGSDLASLRTTAISEGDNYVVNGSKIWTSAAELADHIFVLVKTDTDVKPQLGISFLLIDMKTPGIKVEPLLAFNGVRLWNQVFFDDVVVPKTNRLGEENKGWTVAKTCLVTRDFRFPGSLKTDGYWGISSPLPEKNKNEVSSSMTLSGRNCRRSKFA